MKETYDKYQAAADREVAELHGKANMAGNLFNLFNYKDTRLELIYKAHYNGEEYKPKALKECPCCSKFDDGKKIWLSVDNLALSPLGAAVPGFFDFVKFCIVSFLTIGAIYSIYMMIIYGQGGKCQFGLVTSGCGDQWKFYLSAANNQDSSKDIIERTLMLISFLALYILKVVYFAWFRKLDADSNSFVTDVTDYSVELRGLPQDVTNQDIENFFHEKKKELKSKKGKPIDPIVRRINFVFSGTEEVKKLTETINKNITEFNKFTKEKNEVEAAKKKIEVEKCVKDAKELLDEHYKIPVNIDPKVNPKERPDVERFTGSAYVSFETIEQAELVRDNLMVAGLAKIFYKLFRSLRGPFARVAGAKRHFFTYPNLTNQPNTDPYTTSYFYIEKAEKPAEIVFEHLGLSVINRALRKTFSFLFSVIVIGGTFALILYLKGQENASDTSQTGKLIVVGIGIVIKILGILLSFITTLLIEFEKPETTTERNIGTIWRSTMSVFINSVLVLIVVNVVFKKESLRQFMYTNTGVYNDLLFQLILAVIEAAVSFAEPSIPLGYLKAWLDRRKGAESTIPQYEVNTYYEGAVFNFPRRFGKYLTLMMIVFFLIRIFPYAPFIGAIIAVIFYWSDKFFLLRLAKIPEYNTNELPLSMLRFMDMVFVIWTVGYILYDIIAFDEIFPWSWVMFAIALFSLVCNANYALRKTFVFDSEEQSEKQVDLMTFIKVLKGGTYVTSNPVDVLRLTVKGWKKAEEQREKERKRAEKLRNDKIAQEKEEKRKREKQLNDEKIAQLLKKQKEEEKVREEQAKQQAARDKMMGRQSGSMDIGDIHLAEKKASQDAAIAEELKRLKEAQRALEEEERLEEEKAQEEEEDAFDQDSSEDSDEGVYLQQVQEQAKGNRNDDSSDEAGSDKKSALDEEEMFGMPMDALQEDDDKYTPPEDLDVRLKNLEVKEEMSIPSEKKVDIETKGLKEEPVEPVEP